MFGKSKLSTESYKGVRDFYPEDMFIQNYIFGIWRNVVEKFGYNEYGASILEPAELYKAKSGEEIVSEQTYTFTDRGDREVTLRPEMTPTVARMVAARQRELAFPLRWYSIPNLFRYEKPQRGRVREHWQLNVDLFGAKGSEADAEIIAIAYEIMKKLGAKDEDFIIRVNNRKLMHELYKKFDMTEEISYRVGKLIDKKEKMPNEDFIKALSESIGPQATEFVRFLDSKEKMLEAVGETNAHAVELFSLIDRLQSMGVANIVFDPTLMRGFDYYTGTVFEVFDTHPDNRRSVFGGGRYDDLLDIFGSPKVTAIGFGAGDVTARDFLETHNLLPKFKPTTQLYIATLGKEFLDHAQRLAQKLRTAGLNVAVDISEKKVGDQIKSAHKQSIPYIIAIGENEIKTSEYSLKNMDTGEEKKVKAEEIKNFIK